MSIHPLAKKPAFWQQTLTALLESCKTAPNGLTSSEAAERLTRYGPNVFHPQRRNALLLQFLAKFSNPLVIILLIASTISALTGDVASFIIISLIILMSVTLDFIQEYRAGKEAEKLRQSVTVHVQALRDGKSQEIPLPSLVSGDIVLLAASVERYSKHPLANAILEKAFEENIKLMDAQQISEPKGEGLQGTVDGHEVIITSRKQLEKLGAGKDTAVLPQGAGLECVVLIDHHLAAHYRFRDSPRANSESFIQHLLPKHRFKKVMIVSGDREEEVRYLANSVGIADVYAGQSPEEKVDIVVRETRQAKTAYLGGRRQKTAINNPKINEFLEDIWKSPKVCFIVEFVYKWTLLFKTFNLNWGWFRMFVRERY